MKLEKQVTSLALSKKLKKLGVKQKSLWYWHKHNIQDWELCLAEELPQEPPKGYQFISAFTVAELGEKIDNAFNKLPGTMIMKPKGKFKELWEALTGFMNEAENRAKMLIYLIENKLTKLGKEE